MDGGRNSTFLSCAGCGDRIGVYERVWVREAESAPTEAGHTYARGRLRHGAEVFHLGCLVPDRRPTRQRQAAACARCGTPGSVSDRLPDGSWICWDCMTVEEREHPGA